MLVIIGLPLFLFRYWRNKIISMLNRIMYAFLSSVLKQQLHYTKYKTYKA